MGATTCIIWKPTGLDTIFGCLATSYNNDSSGYKLDFRIRIGNLKVNLVFIRLLLIINCDFIENKNSQLIYSKLVHAQCHKREKYRNKVAYQ